jgi:lysophospholipase L1-like esterase
MPPDNRQPTSRGALWLRVLLLLVSIILALGALEGAMRIRMWLKYGRPTGSVIELVPDPATGLKIPKPGLDTGRIRINAEGFRSPEIPRAKPAGTVRLAFLGGSTTYCAEVSNNEATWPHLVWRSLCERHPQLAFDYVNAGVPGYGQDEMRITLERRVAPYQPDVIFMYEAANDFSTDTRELAARRGLYRGKPEDPSALAKVSVAWFLLEKNLTVRQRQRGASSGHALVYDADSLARPFGDRVKSCLRTAKALAPVCAVATFSHKMRRDQSPAVALANSNTALFYCPYMSVQGILDGFDAYNRAIRAAADSTGAILVSGEDSIPGDDTHFTDSVHLTDEGARAMAKRAVEGLEASPEFQQLLSATARHAGTTTHEMHPARASSSPTQSSRRTD